jgi:hypothetical protein
MAASACSDGPTAVRMTDVVGAWELVHLNRVSAATGETTDAMQSGEITSFTMTVADDGKVVTVTTSVGAPPVTAGGTIAVSGNRTKLVLDGTDFYGDIFLKGGQLTIDCGPTVGLEDFTKITFIFRRP